jgi:CrcB protein
MREVYLGMLVFFGAGMGGVLRHALNRLTPLVIGYAFPYATLVINIVGCLVMGLLAGWFGFRGEHSNQDLRLFLTTGVVGGFTTFSAFSLELVLLGERGQWGPAAAYLTLSIGAGLAAVVTGLALARAGFH